MLYVRIGNTILQYDLKKTINSLNDNNDRVRLWAVRTDFSRSGLITLANLRFTYNEKVK